VSALPAAGSPACTIAPSAAAAQRDAMEQEFGNEAESLAPGPLMMATRRHIVHVRLVRAALECD
jgi:hypothetical protein